jgi:Gpi18-like mannosyltransferase
MEKPWKKYIPGLCGALGALLLLRLEGCGRDTLLVLLLPVGAAMLARAMCMDYAGSDYNNFLSHWYRFFQENGGFQAVAKAVGDYNVPYLYFMAFISYLSTPDLYLIKLFSLVFDVALAWGSLRLVRVLTKDRQGSRAPLIAFAAALLLPTVVLNGAFWGQCDSIYGALAIHAAALLLEGKNKTSVALMAIAFSFKLQAIFVLPLWGVLWLAGKVRFRELWTFPLTYLVTIVPAVLLGKPIGEILGIYFNQMGEYPRLVLNAPSIYQLVPYGTEVNDALLSALGIAAAGVLVLALLALGFLLRDRLDRDLAMGMAVVLCIGVPFLLPRMHERYFFLADVFTLCWACSNVRRVPAAVLAGGSSLMCYIVYLRLKFIHVVRIGGGTFVMLIEMLLMLAALVFSAVVLARQLQEKRKRVEPI